MDGKMELITCTTDGESKNQFNHISLIQFYSDKVRGYLPAAPETKKNMMDLNVEQETLRELSSRRQNLLLELKNYEANQRAGIGPGMNGMVAGTTGVPGEEEVGMIPAQTQLQTALAINLGTEGKTVSTEFVAF